MYIYINIYIQVASVLLNPTPVDTLAQTTDNAVPLALEMTFGGQV